MASSYMDVPFYGSVTLRTSARRLSVMLFVFSFRVTVISYYLLRGVLWWSRSFCLLPPDGVKILRLFIVFTNCPPLAASIGSPPTLPIALL